MPMGTAQVMQSALKALQPATGLRPQSVPVLVQTLDLAAL